jgi:hypothetical protein
MPSTTSYERGDVVSRSCRSRISQELKSGLPSFISAPHPSVDLLLVPLTSQFGPFLARRVSSWRLEASRTPLSEPGKARAIHTGDLILEPASDRLLKKAASGVLSRTSPCDVPQGYVSVAALPAALLDGLFEQPAGYPKKVSAPCSPAFPQFPNSLSTSC